MNQFRYCFFVWIIAAAVSCSANGSNKGSKSAANVTDDFAKYVSLKEKATLYKAGNDTTFLQFRFGMSPDQVKERLQLLEKDSTVNYDYNQRAYSYNINTGRTGSLSIIHCTINPKFYRNELYSIDLFALNDNLAATMMVSAITEKYGSESVKYKVVESSEDTYAWFINHVEIKINELVGGGVLRYTDTKREKLLKEEEQRKSDTGKAKSQSDL